MRFKNELEKKAHFLKLNKFYNYKKKSFKIFNFYVTFL